jgi:HSP20 family protein
MMTLTRYPASEATPWSPAERLSSLRQEMDRLWELTFPGRTASFFTGWTPALDLYDADDRLVAKVELPGMRREDIEISYQEGVLNLTGERAPEAAQQGKEIQPYRTERFSGKFQRSLALPVPVQVDGIQATYKDGILTVEMPKSEEAKPHRVEVSVS